MLTKPIHRVLLQLSSFPGAIVSILIAKAFWTCRDRIADPDLGWHLRNGEFILVHGRFPSSDSYSFTAAGSTWLDHSWLPEVLYYAAYRFLGLTGIFVLFATTITVLMVAVFWLSLKHAEDPLAAAVVTICGALLAMVGFTPRPQNFAWLCFTAIFAILLRFREERRAPLWIIPLLFCLWINCHGSWSLGLAVFGIFLCSGLITHDVGTLASARWTNLELRRLSLVFSLSVAALFINPIGWRLVAYPLDLAFRQPLNVGLIEEWGSVNFNDAERGTYVLITLVGVFALALLPRRRWRIDDALLVAFSLFCGLKHIRLLVLTGIVLPPLLVSQIGRLSTYDPHHERRVLNGFIVGCVLASLAFAFPAVPMLQSQIDQFFPAHALAWIRAHPVTGRLFNQYEWGGFLEWQAPELRPFIDSRADIFEYNGVLRDYLAIANVYHCQELLDHYQIETVLVSADSSLAYFLSKSPEWQSVFADKQAMVYRRTNAGE